MARPAGHRLNREAWDDIAVPKGITPTTTSEATGINRVTVSQLVNGFNRASLPNVKKIADYVGVHPATLFPTVSRYFEHAAEVELEQAG